MDTVIQDLKFMQNRGFTLIELLLYIAIISLVLVSVTGFFWNVVSGNIKENSYQEVQQNGRFVMTKITQEIKKAIGINSPTLGSSANSLSLIMSDSNLNPTVFDVSGGKLRITQGASVPIELTTDQVVVSNLQFTNLSYLNTPGTLRVEMALENLNPSGKNEYRASIDLKTSVSLLKEP
jgi:prepilin-type N-terminal cleavage/methylation domain-containing protein